MTLNRALYWAPRLLGCAFVFFLGLFALDAFSEDRGSEERIVAFLIHLLPALIVGLVVLIAWRRERLGAFIFVVLAIMYPLWAWGQVAWTAHLVISGPLLVTAVLFVVSWKYNTNRHP